MAAATVSSPLRERVVPFTAGDGFACNLVHVRREAEPTKGPVMLVHGAGVRANIFRAPVETTIVDYLIEAGYDVWLENWRASIDLPPNEWTLDQAALYDHPEAVRTIVRETGASEVKAIIHCQGSTSFAMSAVAGLIPAVTTIVSNAVSLHPIVPVAARYKLKYSLLAIGPLFPYLDPQWGLHAPSVRAKLLKAFVQLTHRECDNSVCRIASFTYGVGFPTLWLHENLNDETHDWLSHEFGAVPTTFFEQMTRCVTEGHLVSVDGHPELPADYVASPPATQARFAFFAGEENRCFLPSSQEATFAYFDALRPGYHSFHRIPDYGHLDIFMGKNAARDVFPLILQELDRGA